METTEGLVISSSDAPGGETPPEPTPDVQPAAPASQEPAGTPADPATAPTEPSQTDDDDAPVSPRELRRLVGRMTRRNADVERELAAALARVDTLTRVMQPPPQAPPPQAPAGPPVRPRYEDFGDDESYRAAEDQYFNDTVTYRLEQRDTQQRQQSITQQQQQSDAEKLSAIRAKEAEVVKAVPDYYDRFDAIHPRLAPHLLWALQQAGVHGPDLVLHLAAHPDEIPRLNQVPVHLIGVELGMMRAGSPSPAASPPPAANGQTSAPNRLPEPPQPVGGGGATVVPGYRDDMTQQQFDDWARRTYPSMPYTHRR